MTDEHLQRSQATTNPDGVEELPSARSLRSADERPWSRGPWINNQDSFIESDFDGAIIVVQINNELGDVTDEEITGNANLIAAAPELYDALEALVTATESTDNPGHMGVSRDDDAMIAARSALAKARGESASDRQNGVSPVEGSSSSPSAEGK